MIQPEEIHAQDGDMGIKTSVTYKFTEGNKHDLSMVL